MTTLSAVIIARNEEETIGLSIQSVIKAAHYARDLVKSYEIIFVDSNSNDRTIEVASRFPITILRLQEQYASPSAGLHVGDRHACGKYVLFLGGDMVIPEKWLLHTIRYLIQNPNIGGVCGPLLTVPMVPGSKLAVKHAKWNTNSSIYTYIPRAFLTDGPVLYNKKILEHVGSFDPWIRGEEERELGFRIRRANFELHELNIPAAVHFMTKRKTRLMHGVRYSQGIGQLLRANGRTSLAIDLLRQYWFLLSLLAWMPLNCIIIFLGFFGIIHHFCWLTVIGINVLAFVTLVKTQHGAKKAIRKLGRSILQAFSILVGFLAGKPNRVTLPNGAVKLIKKGNVFVNESFSLKEKLKFML